MDASYIPIAEARGFTTHWIKISHIACQILFYRFPINIALPFEYDIVY